MREIIIARNDAGQRLDKFLTKAMPLLPQSMLYKGLRKNCVRINGRHAKDGAARLNEGDVLALYFKDEFFEKIDENEMYLHASPDISVVYEDENILLADKPQGMVVHEDDSGASDTLIARIQSYLYKKGEWKPEEEQSFAPALCNRIDRNTGGIVIAAKNAEALRIMNEKIKNREMQKLYLCIVCGVPEKREDTLTGYLFKDEKKKQVYIYPVSKKGSKSIATKYRVLAEKNSFALIETELLTGRTHQIRAHFASIGHPLLGDGKYGDNRVNKRMRFSRQALYSYSVMFNFKTDGGALQYLNGKKFTLPYMPFEDFFKN
jgi:23S rRNA pseudouridine955/2504/2580 synthase